MIDFVKYRYISYIVSFGILLVGILGYYLNGFRYSVDFTGGTQVSFKFNKSVGSENLKDILARNGWEDAVIREFSPLDVSVRVKEFSNDSAGLAQKIKLSLENTLSDSNITATIVEASCVGPSVGGMLRKNAVIAVLWVTLILLLYIAIRSRSFAYGIGAVVALLHDAIAILAVFALLHKEISPNVIGAMLAMLGYSINDTIVIFARIRQNLEKIHDMTAEEIVNLSINQTLKRTILMSFATALVVLAMFFFGGESLHNMSIALLVGIVVGTYSSIYIASPLMLMFAK